MRHVVPIRRYVQPKFCSYHLVLSSVTVPFFSDCCWIKDPSHTLKYWWLYWSYQFDVCVVSHIQQQPLQVWISICTQLNCTCEFSLWFSGDPCRRSIVKYHVWVTMFACRVVWTQSSSYSDCGGVHGKYCVPKPIPPAFSANLWCVLNICQYCEWQDSTIHLK